MEQEFFEFLRSSSSSKIFNYDDNSKLMVNKVRYNDKLDILYSLNSYSGNLFDLHSPFKYSGIYDKENNKLFDVEYGIRYNILNWKYDDSNYISDGDLYNMINVDVNDKIKEIIDNGKEDIFNINEVEISEEITDNDVIKEFMNGSSSNTLEDLYCKYSTEKSQNILDYLTDKETFLEEEARDFIIDNMTGILKGLAITEEKRKQLKSIENNVDHPYHKIKNIIDSIKNNNCVTVNLTINKDGVEQIFKYNADALVNNYNSSYLSTYNIEKLADRNLFEETFGRWNDLHYEDIIKITYGKNIIYEDTNFKEKEEEKCPS